MGKALCCHGSAVVRCGGGVAACERWGGLTQSGVGPSVAHLRISLNKKFFVRRQEAHWTASSRDDVWPVGPLHMREAAKHALPVLGCVFCCMVWTLQFWRPPGACGLHGVGTLFLACVPFLRRACAHAASSAFISPG